MRSIFMGVLFSGLILGVALTGCSKKGTEQEVKHAVALLNPTQGSKVQGAVSFEKAGSGIRVTANIEGLSPGPHGFHIHEYGDCSSPDGNSAGGHFNPTEMPHGAPSAEKHHAGDLGNITADNSGVGKMEMTLDFLSFEGPKSIIGRSVIVHAQADDLKAQPAGNAGPRIACGVIGITK